MSQMVSSGAIPSFIMTKRYISKTGKRIWIKLKVEAITTAEGAFVMYLSQVAPAEVWSPTAPAAVSPPPAPARLAHFMQDNWKWMLPILSTIGTATWIVIVKYIELISLLDGRQ